MQIGINRLRSLHMEDRDCRRTTTGLPFWLRKASTVKTPKDAATFCDKIRQLSFEGMGSELSKRAVISCLYIMRSFSIDRSVQSSGLLAMAALSEKQHLSALIGERGGVVLLLDAWNRFSLDDIITKNCVVTMRSLSETERNRQAFCANQGVNVIVRTYEIFAHRVSIQIATAALVANLCYENEERRKVIIDCKVTEFLINGLAKFNTPNHFRLHTNCCLALRNISVDEPGCNEILRFDSELCAITSVLQTSCSHSSTTGRPSGFCITLQWKRVARIFLRHAFKICCHQF